MTEPFSAEKPPSELSLVEIAGQLDKVTLWIEQQRVAEREARKVYQAVAQEVETAEKQILQYARQLVDAQARKVGAFRVMLDRDGAQQGPRRGRPPKDRQGSESGPGETTPKKRGSKKNMAQAILSIWSLGPYKESLTTEEILDALPETGFVTTATATSLKSAINQSLSKLCREGQVVRYRSDGVRMTARDTKWRAKKYLAATLAEKE